MTINIEYETDKPLDVDYEKVANDIIPAALTMRNVLMRQR